MSDFLGRGEVIPFHPGPRHLAVCLACGSRRAPPALPPFTQTEPRQGCAGRDGPAPRAARRTRAKRVGSGRRRRSAGKRPRRCGRRQRGPAAPRSVWRSRGRRESSPGFGAGDRRRRGRASGSGLSAAPDSRAAPGRAGPAGRLLLLQRCSRESHSARCG